jgi:hypothetical protein
MKIRILLETVQLGDDVESTRAKVATKSTPTQIREQTSDDDDRQSQPETWCGKQSEAHIIHMPGAEEERDRCGIDRQCKWPRENGRPEERMMKTRPQPKGIRDQPTNTRETSMFEREGKESKQTNKQTNENTHTCTHTHTHTQKKKKKRSKSHN